MPPPAPVFSDRIVQMAAELANLGKRPVSTATFNELKRVHLQLDALIKEFVPCERCGNLFPNIAQLTLGNRSANMCASCAITALQRGTIEATPAEQVNVATSAASAVSPPVAPPPQVDPPAPRVEKVEPKPVAKAVVAEVKPRPVVAPAPRLPVPPPVEEEELEDEIERDEEDDDDGVEETGEGEGELELDAPPRRSPARSPRLVARGASNDSGPLKATHGEVAKYLNRPTREVKQIAHLVEEISPPMDVPKTTRYVLSELRNARSKISPETATKIVQFLKSGIPGGGNGDRGGK